MKCDEGDRSSDAGEERWGRGWGKPRDHTSFVGLPSDDRDYVVEVGLRQIITRHKKD